MTDDLVTRYRLREGDMEPSPFGLYVRHDDHAARIEQDAATIARLEGERDALRNWRAEAGAEYRARQAAEAKVAALVEALREIAAEASVPVHTWRNGINFKKMYEGWRKIAVERIDIARAAIAAAKGGIEIPASAENGRATVSRITKGDVSQSSAD